MVRGWWRPQASDICPLTGVSLLPTIHIGSPLASQGNPCVTITPHPKERQVDQRRDTSVPWTTPIPKLFRATMRQMGQESDTKKRAPATNCVPFVPSTDTKTSPPSGHIVPTVPPLLNPLQLPPQRGGSDGAVGLAVPTQVKLAQTQRAHPPRGLWARGEHHA